MQGLQSASWEDALAAASAALGKFKGGELRFIAGKLADAESLISLKVCPRMLIDVSGCLHDA
jgi:NADH dehydrogenase (ubiquinone) Fe-S protein 1